MAAMDAGIYTVFGVFAGIGLMTTIDWAWRVSARIVARWKGATG